ncbi:hypothetical protein [Flavobacterium sp. MDT1-60]|uniref:hypothetical protein n=1 Tax=Flavobacterium sp. MDT1-60 TaxID=1979344 RepID=UPI001782F418|nr:hypothetical protein [Flavobacterium sp. MDT1-60]QOG01540.1 hypothetical protein IHE43_17225 [Flavobacterium sp. MDT1-60]
MLGILSLILMILPLLFQFIYGAKAIFKTTSMTFGKVSLTSFILQIIFSTAIFGVTYYNFSKYFDEHPDKTRCLTPIAGLIFLLPFLTIVLLVTIAVQYFIKQGKKIN